MILISHSYGGIPTTESTKGASKIERESQGKKGGIVHIGYMTSIVPAVGESSATSGQTAGGLEVTVLVYRPHPLHESLTNLTTGGRMDEN